MKTDNYNRALDKLVFYRRMAVIAERETPTYTAYVERLEAGISILAIACDKDLDKVRFDVREAYESKYWC